MIPFRKWIWQDRENRLTFKIAVTAICMQFVIFKFLYPFPNFMPPDSNSYVEAAFNNQMINFWAIGYSKFLRLVSSFNSSHWSLVWVQYLFLQACLLYFFYSLRYLLFPGKGMFRLLLGLSALNPLLPHISNFVSSDALFTALSVLWFSQLLWINYNPGRRLLIFHSLVLLFAFMVRYNALYYPVISVAIVIFANISIREKILSVSLIVALLGTFVGRTEYKYYINTGISQYSAFAGWQMASNALYGYAYATSDSCDKVPMKFRELHIVVNKHMDSLRKLPQASRPDREVAIYYLWDEHSPLKQYLRNSWRGDSTTLFFKRWATVAPLYGDYGAYLIKSHPLLFARYYVWPNLIKYFAPPAKFMSVYNMEEETVAPIVATWFGWEDNRLFTRFKDKKVTITGYFTMLMAVINIGFILTFVSFISLGYLYSCTPYKRRIIQWMFVIWISNMGFSVLSAPIELRYQLFPMIVTSVFAALLVECMVREIPREGRDV